MPVRKHSWRAAAQRLAVASASLRMANRLGGLSRLPTGMLSDLDTALGLQPLRPVVSRPSLVLVVDNTRTLLLDGPK